MGKKYSRVYKVENRRFRYDYEKALLCWLGENNEVVYSISLSRDNWSENPRYWCEMCSYEIDQELRYLW